MTNILGWLLGTGCACYCYWDASQRRMQKPWLWAVFGLFTNPLTIALLHGHRWLLSGETREGGRGWDSCRWLAMNTTVAMFFAGISGLISVAGSATFSGSDASIAGAAIGTTLGIGFILMIWILLSGSFLIIGLMMKKSVREVGPTGPLATRA